MTDRTIENLLSEEERKGIIEDAIWAINLNIMAGFEIPEDEKEYHIYCALNDVSREKRLDAVFEVEGFAPLDHSVVEKSRITYENYKKRLAQEN